VHYTPKAMNIIKSTRRFEAFLAKHGRLVSEDLALKHQKMAEGEFSFLRATFYRWAQQFPVVCGDLCDAPRVLGVGDLHVENFGTWRDAEGRLVWGINDFDEACKLPYAADLVRLAVSAMLAVESCRLEMDPARVCGAILDGYAQGIGGDGEPFVLAERHHWLGTLATLALKEPDKFWNNFQQLPALRKRLPTGASSGIRMLLPKDTPPCRVARRVAGLGSLGKERFVALAESHGSGIAREAKAISPSAWYWAMEETMDELFYEEILERAVRCRDPWVRVRGRWLIRRLAPDCGRVELATLAKSLEAEHLLHAMGQETANIHLGSSKSIKAIRKDLAKRKPGWLRRAAKEMGAALRADWKQWANRGTENIERK
jgi:uncharacterized protein (DUF2252 family)